MVLRQGEIHPGQDHVPLLVWNLAILHGSKENSDRHMTTGERGTRPDHLARNMARRLDLHWTREAGRALEAVLLPRRCASCHGVLTRKT